MSDNEEVAFVRGEEDVPQRTSSAPPVLEVQEQSLFALGNTYAHFFSGLASDIRTDDDYLQFYQSYNDPSKLPPPLEPTAFELPDEELLVREQYSPSGSPPMGHRHPYLPFNFDEREGSSPRWSRPIPKRVASISSLEEFSLDENALIPDLSSDSESISSSIDDIPTLVQNFGNGALHGSGGVALGDKFANRHLWESESIAENGLASPRDLQQPSQPLPRPTSNGNVPPPGLTVASVEQALGDMEIAGDAQLQRRREPRRGAAPKPEASGILCRYFAQGYCSRGERCNFAHTTTEPTASAAASAPALAPAPAQSAHQTVPSAATPATPPALPAVPQAAVGHGAVGTPSAAARAVPASPSPPPTATSSVNTASQPLPVPPTGGQAKNGKRGGANVPPGHKRRHSAGLAHAPAAAAPTFAVGTNTLAGRFTSIDQVIGQIYPMCKDQHGCRFLQKKLDEENPQVVDAIFNEVYPHFAELMTDPFGNYLCQKLLEHCGEKQRLMLIESVASDLVRISQNMHGTRAVQKMIECLRNPQEIRLVTRGLRASVVPLIKDLNGNHVVQRCLNHLSAADNQFIYDAVAGHCVEVATHRHGCCVLQRCIDHASDSQKLQLVNEITSNGLTLVKDPYGNYVVQYVLDLPYPHMLANLIAQFKNHLAELSTQKFSSNVVEKCLTVGDPGTRAWMIQELAETDQLKTLIQDPFGNYVIQTAMSIADPPQHARLVEGIKPFLFSLRNTPYGKRIQNRILKDAQNAEHKRAASIPTGPNKSFHK